ncbi:hypothetical protein OQE50_01760 [Enterobacter kobei]|uniref:hypothetical protein n=1 Tax=Enterobacter kobei TaxID=208224 RepID=UPI00224AC983|nr:hypothetical protein [Enterobacter kobei]UZQ68086.1 hypothetical protein OQE50_01760 [Enterobacter kobei]
MVKVLAQINIISIWLLNGMVTPVRVLSGTHQNLLRLAGMASRGVPAHVLWAFTRYTIFRYLNNKQRPVA